VRRIFRSPKDVKLIKNKFVRDIFRMRKFKSCQDRNKYNSIFVFLMRIKNEKKHAKTMFNVKKMHSQDIRFHP
jgi:hypothetical protein